MAKRPVDSATESTNIANMQPSALNWARTGAPILVGYCLATGQTAKPRQTARPVGLDLVKNIQDIVRTGDLLGRGGETQS